MNITLLKRLMDELGFSETEAMAYLDQRTVFTVQLADLLRGEIEDVWPAMGGNTTGAVAGQFSTVQLFNPADSGVLVTVEAYTARKDVGGTSYYLRYHDALLGVGVAQRNWRDSIIPGLPAAQIGALAQVAAAGVISQTQWVDGTSSNYKPLHWVLYPGNGIHLQPLAANLPMSASFFWNERPFNPRV